VVHLAVKAPEWSILMCRTHCHYPQRAYFSHFKWILRINDRLMSPQLMLLVISCDVRVSVRVNRVWPPCRLRVVCVVY